MKTMRLEDLKVVWQSLFSFELDENKFIEIAYDNKDKHFGNTVHIILDIDNPNNHTFLREEDARKWYASWEQVWRWRKPKNENTP